MYDCIIVGAGPAGGTAAYHLAKQGRSVLVIEKEPLPRYKACGGGVSPAIAQWFDFDFSPAISTKADTIRCTWKMGDPVESALGTPEPVWMVKRDVFDHFLIQQAQGKGAELKDNTEVTGIAFQSDHWQVNTKNGAFSGKYLIAADGAKGPMAKWLGFKERKLRLAESLEVSANTSGNQVAEFEFGLVKNGYLWNFPKADSYSISVGSFIGGDPQDYRKQLQEYCQALGLDFKGAKTSTHPMCLWNGNQTLHTQNAVIAGEAAAIVDPFTGEGIRPSMFTGMLAADAVNQSLAGDRAALEKYSDAVNEQWGTEMTWAQKLAGIFYRFPGVGYKVGVKRPAAVSMMGKILCGELRYGDVAGRAIKRLTPFG